MNHINGQRKTDNDTWARLMATVDRYKILWAVAMAMGTWLGKEIIEPLRSVPVIVQQQGEIINTLVRIQCVQLSAEDRYKYNVDCQLPSTTPQGNKP